MSAQLLHGDCLDLLKTLPAGSVDMVLADLPYGTTACKWDSVIPFEPLWAELNRVTKPNAAMCMFGSEPFSSALRMSNLENFRYDWVWQKDKASNFLFANKQPAKVTEYISTFYRKQPKYFSQKTVNPKGPSKRHLGKNSDNTVLAKELMANMPSKRVTGRHYEPDKLLGKNLVYFARESACGVKTQHPTQKPIALLEHLIRAYTNEGDTVLDPTMGSGSTGVACKNLNRKFIGIEKDNKYFQIAERRILNPAEVAI